jgi:hypothetical protein
MAEPFAGCSGTDFTIHKNPSGYTSAMVSLIAPLKGFVLFHHPSEK